jgi:hypothetical protein
LTGGAVSPEEATAETTDWQSTRSITIMFKLRGANSNLGSRPTIVHGGDVDLPLDGAVRLGVQAPQVQLVLDELEPE